MKIPNIVPNFQKEYNRIRDKDLRLMVDALVYSVFVPSKISRNKKIERYGFVFSQPKFSTTEIVHFGFVLPNKKGFHLRLYHNDECGFEFKIGCVEQLTKHIRFDTWFDGVVYNTFDDFFSDVVNLTTWVQK